MVKSQVSTTFQPVLRRPPRSLLAEEQPMDAGVHGLIDLWYGEQVSRDALGASARALRRRRLRFDDQVEDVGVRAGMRGGRLYTYRRAHGTSSIENKTIACSS